MSGSLKSTKEALEKTLASQCRVHTIHTVATAPETVYALEGTIASAAIDVEPKDGDTGVAVADQTHDLSFTGLARTLRVHGLSRVYDPTLRVLPRAVLSAGISRTPTACGAAPIVKHVIAIEPGAVLERIDLFGPSPTVVPGRRVTDSKSPSTGPVVLAPTWHGTECVFDLTELHAHMTNVGLSRVDNWSLTELLGTDICDGIVNTSAISMALHVRVRSEDSPTPVHVLLDGVHVTHSGNAVARDIVEGPLAHSAVTVEHRAPAGFGALPGLYDTLG